MYNIMVLVVLVGQHVSHASSRPTVRILTGEADTPAPVNRLGSARTVSNYIVTRTMYKNVGDNDADDDW